MTHIAVQEALDGKNINWLQKVTDEEYLAGPPEDAQKALRLKRKVPQCPAGVSVV